MLVKRTAGRVLQTLLRQDIRGMPIRKSMLDPHKHNTMNHNLNLRYNDVWDYGKYPDYYLIHSVAPRTYEPKVIETICALIH